MDSNFNSNGVRIRLPSQFDAKNMIAKRDPKALGEGAFGKVYASTPYAMVTKVFKAKTEVEYSTVRELAALKTLNGSKHILQLLHVDPDTLNMYTPLFDCELAKSKCTGKLNAYQIRTIMQQLLLALLDLKRKCLFHRDIKPQNIFVKKDNLRTVLADLGSCRPCYTERDVPELNIVPQEGSFNSLLSFTSVVTTLWYRAPEMIYQNQTAPFSYYTYAADMFSLGCVFAFLLNDSDPLFEGFNEIDQFALYANFLARDEADFLRIYPKTTLFQEAIQSKQKISLEAALRYSLADASALYLLRAMLDLDPTRRISVEDALAHPYLTGGRTVPIVKLPPLVRRMQDLDTGTPFSTFLLPGDEKTHITRTTVFQWMYRKVLEHTASQKARRESYKKKEKDEEEEEAEDDSGISVEEVEAKRPWNDDSEYILSLQLLFSSYALFDRYVQKQTVNNARAPIVMASCYALAMTLFQEFIPTHEDYLFQWYKNAYSVSELKTEMLSVLNALDYNLFFPTEYHYAVNALQHAFNAFTWPGRSTDQSALSTHVPMFTMLRQVLDLLLVGLFDLTIREYSSFHLVQYASHFVFSQYQTKLNLDTEVIPGKVYAHFRKGWLHAQQVQKQSSFERLQQLAVPDSFERMGATWFDIRSGGGEMSPTKRKKQGNNNSGKKETE